MHIPDVTDQMLEKVLASAVSPVAVLFMGITMADRSALALKRLMPLADTYDARMIFLKINADENPTPMGWWCHGDLPLLVIFRAGGLVARLHNNFTKDDIEQLIIAALNA